MVISYEMVDIVLVKENGSKKSRGNADALTCYLRLTSRLGCHEHVTNY